MHINILLNINILAIYNASEFCHFQSLKGLNNNWQVKFKAWDTASPE